MHRWLKALFSLVMVLQFAWAAIGLHGVYEMKAPATDIAGEPFERVDGPQDVSMAGDQESRCAEGTCLGHTMCAAMESNPSISTFHARGVIPAIATVGSGDSHIPHGLDRPNWHRI